MTAASGEGLEGESAAACCWVRRKGRGRVRLGCIVFRKKMFFLPPPSSHVTRRNKSTRAPCLGSSSLCSSFSVTADKALTYVVCKLCANGGDFAAAAGRGG